VVEKRKGSADLNSALSSGNARGTLKKTLEKRQYECDQIIEGLDSATFADYFEKIVFPWADSLNGPKCVIGDGLSTHFSVEVIKKCCDRDIRYVVQGNFLVSSFLPTQLICYR